MNVALIVVLVILVICIVQGYRQGFIKTVFRLCSFALSLVVAAMVGPVIAKGLAEDTSFADKLNEGIYEVLELEKLEPDRNQIEQAVLGLPLPERIQEELVSFANSQTFERLGVQNNGEYIAKTLTIVIVYSACYVFVFLITAMLLAFVANALNLVSKLSLLNSVNRLTGAGVGFLEAVIVISVAMAVITMFSGTGWGSMILAQISESDFLSFIYANNPVNSLLLDFSTKIN